MPATPTPFDSGTVTINDGTEHSFAATNPATPGVHGLFVDMTSRPAGVAVVLRAYVKNKTAGSAIEVYKATVDDSSPNPNWRCPPLEHVFTAADSVKFTYQRTTGATSFTADWVLTQF